MNSVEERIRAATQAAGGAVREVRRPLELPDSGALDPLGTGGRARRALGSRRWKTWMAPVAAAAAVLTIGVCLVIARGIPNGGVASPRVSVSAVPRYYVAVKKPVGWVAYAPLSGKGAPVVSLVVGETFTGKSLATVAPPRGTTFMGVTAAADDRTFVVDTAPVSSLGLAGPGVSTAPRAWYLLRIHPGGTPAARLTKLPIPVTPNGTFIYGIAVSPDGTRLAIAEASMRDANRGVQTVRIYSVRSGALLLTYPKMFTGYSAGLPDQTTDSSATLSWASDGHELAWIWRVLADPAGGAHLLLVELTLPAHGQPSDWTWDSHFPDCGPAGGLLAAANGNTLVCTPKGVATDVGTRRGGIWCGADSGWRNLGFAEYSTVTSASHRALSTVRTNCHAGIGLAGAMWASASGEAVIGWVYPSAKGAGRPYVFTADGYRPLPAFPAGVVFPGVAW